MNDKVLLAWVHTGTVHEPFARTIAELCLHKPNRIVGITATTSPRQEESRNATIHNFLETDADWLMWIDTDMTLEKNAIELLLETAHQHEADIAGAIGYIYNRLTQEITPNGYHWDDDKKTYVSLWDYNPGETYTVDATGSGCVLIHRRVFESWDDENWHETWHTHPYTGGHMGHDLAFCFKSKREYGHKIVWNTNIKSGHIKPFELTEANYIAYRDSLLERPYDL